MDEKALEKVTRELYRADPGDFTDLRSRRAAEAADHDGPELASAIRRLRKPTTAAWALNLMAHNEKSELDALIDIGEKLRSAQRDLRGEEIRTLAGNRSDLVRRLRARAEQLAADNGHPLGDQAGEQVERTLNAALADPDSGHALRAGTLSKPLEYSGFGLDELSMEAIRRSQSPSEHTRSGKTSRVSKRRGTGKQEKRVGKVERESPRKQTADQRPETKASKSPGDRDKLRQELRQLREELDQTADDLHDAEDDVRRIERDHETAEQRRAELRGELDYTERKLKQSGREAATAQRARDRAAQRYDALQERVRDLERRLRG